MNENKEKYADLLSREQSIPLFSRDWWLDAVCGPENWDVILVEKGGAIVASMPLFFQKKYGFRIVTMPPLTQTMGAWIKYQPNMKSQAAKIKYENEICSSLIDMIPAAGYFKQNFNYSFTNWLPFYWRDFEQNTRYTYLIDDLSDTDALFGNLKGSVRTDIRKAEKELKVIESDDIERFYNLNKLAFAKVNKKLSYGLDLVKKLDAAASERNKRKILLAENEAGEACAGIYLVWDDESAYYLMGWNDPGCGNTGAASMLLWEAVKFASSFARKFNFEGSMIKPIEKFFRSFGASQQQYFRISKVNSIILKLAFAAKGLLK